MFDINVCTLIFFEFNFKIINIINLHRYTKVIDNIKNIRKEQLINIKLETQKISFLEKDKFKAESVSIFSIDCCYSNLSIIDN